MWKVSGICIRAISNSLLEKKQYLNKYIKFIQYQPGGETFSFFGDSGEQLEILNFLLISRIWGSLSAAIENKEAPKGACQCQNIKHEIASGHQAPVRPQPQPGSRKFRSSYCSQAEQKKEKVSPPGVRVINVPG